jgi:hypothetical protein
MHHSLIHRSRTPSGEKCNANGAFRRTVGENAEVEATMASSQQTTNVSDVTVAMNGSVVFIGTIRITRWR